MRRFATHNILPVLFRDGFRTATAQLRLLTCALAVLAGAGCQTTGLRPAALTPSYKPDNIFKFANALDANVRRVVVLPVVTAESRSDMANGCAALEPVLLAELTKTKRFEVVCVPPKFLKARTGRAAWSAGDVLPQDFFELLREHYGCDAVLFAELTEYRAYSPLAIGWRFKLVDARSRYPLWAGDELFDASQPQVTVAARRFSGSTRLFGAEAGSDWAILHSPRRFAEYATAQMFDTLPVR